MVLSSSVALFLPGFREAAGIHGLGLVLLVVTAAGNLSGICLILSRNRVAPAFFTLYPPLLVVLTLLLEPNLLETVNARLAAIGSTDQLSSIQLMALMAVNVVIVVLMVGYFVRSERVQAVFGTRGLQLLRPSKLSD
jgi:hypothetical protein